jgi:hypothetical protein
LGLCAGADSQALTNEDVIKMVRAQLSTNIIIATIDSANFNFDLSPTGLIGLKEAGVEDRIIEAMQTKVRTRDAGTTTDATRGQRQRSPNCWQHRRILSSSCELQDHAR